MPPLARGPVVVEEKEDDEEADDDDEEEDDIMGAGDVDIFIGIIMGELPRIADGGGVGVA